MDSSCKQVRPTTVVPAHKHNTTFRARAVGNAALMRSLSLGRSRPTETHDALYAGCRATNGSCTKANMQLAELR